jgi:hypothetical protein
LANALPIASGEIESAHRYIAQAVTEAKQQEAARKESERAARKAPQDAAADAKGEAPASKKPREKEPRASTTDAQARVMKMADGGFRPAYNVQFATDTKSTVCRSTTSAPTWARCCR